MARKGLYVICVAFCLVLMNAVPAFASFLDVSDQGLNTKINDLVQKKVINGFTDGTFRPADQLTRAQMAKMIVLAQGYPIRSAASDTSTFNDIPGSHWAKLYVAASSNAGIICGYPDGTFRPNKKITRAELARMLCRALEIKPVEAERTTYTDVYSTYWAFDDVETVSYYQLMGGFKDGSFHPAEAATRAQAAVAIYKVMNRAFPKKDAVNDGLSESTSTVQTDDSTATAPENDGKLIICIDAGHGGKDPGAIAKSNGLTEKEVNLDVALKIQSLLKDKADQVIMTRVTDKFVGLSERAQIANEARADLFISIHHNASATSAAAGAAVFCFPGSNSGAELAEIIQKELIKAFGWENVAGKDDGTKTANFAVLRETSMTAVLCESAYLSNPEEAALLATDSFLQAEANAVFKGITKYVDINGY